MKNILFVLIIIILSGCSPNKLSEEQIKIAAEQCGKEGGCIEIFNSPLVSRCDCRFKGDKN